ncbi:VC0807 family protein [Saccharopolyspora erythraea]|uniref:VC0807 family protein n=1 Tax=Saccharopolyspora erythraea TaxID=1836 RepID=UPI002011293A|nr:VC0807 family protein [Saccharopolyspora erythraea]
MPPTDGQGRMFRPGEDRPIHRPHVVHLDGLASHLWHAAKHLGETVFVPLLLFYVLFRLTDLTGGLLAALGWALAALVVRLVLRAPVPMVLWATTALLVARTALGFATGSSFVYFLEPSLQNFLLALALLVTLRLENPFLVKLAGDFCVLPPELIGNTRVQWFFRRVSVLWAAVFTVNGLTTLWALAQATIDHFLLVSTVGSFGLVAVAAVASLLWFRRELRGEGIQLRFGRRPAAAG